LAAKKSGKSTAKAPRKKLRKPTAVTGLQIAEYLAKNPRGARLGDIAAGVAMDVGQTHRMINAMLEDGWVMSVSDNGTYALTARIISIGTTYTGRLDIYDHAHSFMDDIFQKTGESVFLGELRNDVIVCVGRRLSDRTLSVWTEVGRAWPLADTSVGAAIIAAKVERLGPESCREQVNDEVLTAIREGYARDYGRYRSGVESVSAAIRNSAGIEVATISIGAPSSRMGSKEVKTCGQLVKEAAAAISERLGWLDKDKNRLGHGSGAQNDPEDA
jgi:DNA-binding IclR family transcriptional regulator